MSYEIIKADISRDSDVILDFWNSNNEKKLDKKFAWIYRSNPDGEAATWLVKHSETSEIVGMASVFPRRFRFKEATFVAGIQGDFIINIRHRSFGPALMLIREIVSSLNELNFDFLFSFPNRQAEPIFRRAGYNLLGVTDKYTRLFDVSRLLSEKKLIPEVLLKLVSPIANQLLKLVYPDTWVFNMGRFKTVTTDRITVELEDLIRVYHQNTFATYKTKEYLIWKYENDPDDKNKFFFLMQGNIAVGCIVYCIDDDERVNIREILHNQDRTILTALMSMFFREIKRLNCEYAYAQIYENSNILLSSNNLDLTVARQGRNVFYLTNKSKDSHVQLEKLIKSSHFSLFESDEDT